jgi:hypothetical protein
MAELDIKCEVSLWEGIVLATQADTNYQTLQWTLSSGTEATVSIVVPKERPRTMRTTLRHLTIL